ncbi:MAG TPA: cupin domain-containing protein [Xanthobacteraceae bacterium]|nr:cupin domain-containing protein [Xanthobacteraceae bacterium]
MHGMAAFDAKLAAAHMRGQWKSEEFLMRAIGGPKPAGVPALWRWPEVARLLDEAGDVMQEALQARRSLIFQNPGLPRGTTHTLNMGVQMIRPGETAWAHRHSIAALRFIIKGHPKLSTIVDGERCVMEDYDLVLTPSWAWHDHHNESGAAAYWLDVLDVGLVLGLNQTFYEPGSGKDQPGPDGDGRPNLQLRYRWRDVEPELARRPVTPADGKLYEYHDKAGGPALPTLACQAQSLPPGFATSQRRRTSSAVYFVIRGKGQTLVDGETLSWAQNDCFALPNWARHQHINRSASEDALLFSVHDTPALRALGLYREDNAV